MDLANPIYGLLGCGILLALAALYCVLRGVVWAWRRRESRPLRPRRY